MSSTWPSMYHLPTRGMVGLAFLNNLIMRTNYLNEKLKHDWVAGTLDTATNWGVDNAGGAWASDSSPQGTITLAVSYTSEVWVLAHIVWMDSAAYATSCKFRIYNNTDGVGSNSPGYLGSEYASVRQGHLVIGRFIGVAAGNKAFKLQASRETSGRTVNVLARWMMAVGFSTAH